jgi:single-stranded DNA-binding protein
MINKVMLVGTVKSQPQKKGAAISFRVGTWRYIHDGRRFDASHSIEAFGKNGEIASTLKEGELVAIEGSIKHSSYEKEGKKVWFTSVVASSVGRAGEPDNQSNTQSNSQPQARNGQAPASYPPNQAAPRDGSDSTNYPGYDKDVGF